MWNKPGISHTPEQWDELAKTDYLGSCGYSARISVGAGIAVATHFVRFECDADVAWVAVAITESFKHWGPAEAAEYAIDFMEQYSGDNVAWPHHLTLVI